MIVGQADGNKMTHIQSPIKYCAKVGTNLFSLTWEVLQNNKLSSDSKNDLFLKLETASSEKC